MVVVYKYYEKLYIQLKTVVCYIYYIVKILNSLVQVILDAIAIGKHIDQVKQYQSYVLSEMTRVVLCKSIPAMLLIILCCNQLSLLFNRKVQRRLKFTMISIAIGIVVSEIVIFIIDANDILREPTQAKAQQMALVVFTFDTILVCTYLLLMVVLVLFLHYKQRKDQLLLECLDRVFTQTKYEMVVFSFYLVITSIQMAMKRNIEYQLYNYQVFVLTTTILSYLVGLLYGLVFVSPKRITIQ